MGAKQPARYIYRPPHALFTSPYHPRPWRFFPPAGSPFSPPPPLVWFVWFLRLSSGSSGSSGSFSSASSASYLAPPSPPPPLVWFLLLVPPPPTGSSLVRPFPSLLFPRFPLGAAEFSVALRHKKHYLLALCEVIMFFGVFFV